jgi:hypothetical protein
MVVPAKRKSQERSRLRCRRQSSIDQAIQTRALQGFRHERYAEACCNEAKCGRNTGSLLADPRIESGCTTSRMRVKAFE